MYSNAKYYKVYNKVYIPDILRHVYLFLVCVSACLSVAVNDWVCVCVCESF